MTDVLWVSAETPDRGLGGGQIRGSYLLEALARRASVHLVTVGAVRDAVLRDVLAGVTEATEPAPRSVPQSRVARGMEGLRRAALVRDPEEVWATAPARAALRDALAGAPNADIAVVQHSGGVDLLDDLRAGRRLIDLQHLLSRQAEHALAIAPARRHRWVATQELGKARRLEHRASVGYDLVTVCSDEDAAVLTRPAGVVPNGVDVARFAFSPLPAALRLLFSGSVSWRPNVDAAQWFCGAVLPLVRARVPEVTLDIVGLHPAPEVLALGSDAVSIHDERDVVPFLRACRVSVVPVRIGSGTRLKALEAMAAGRALAGTSVGLEGLHLRDGVSAAIADQPESLAERIIGLLRDKTGAEQNVAAARTLVDERFRWEKIGQEFASLVLDGSS